MSLIYQSFSLIQGQDKDLVVTIRDNDDALVDLTGGSARFVMARNPQSSSLVVDSDASPATATIALTDPTNGVLTVTITDTVSDGLLGDYYYELKFTSPAGRELVTTRGYITMERSLL